MNSKSLVKKNLIICFVLCLMLVSIFLPVYAQAEAVEQSIQDLSYSGSTNKVNCAIKAKADQITFSDGLIKIKGMKEINIVKISQSILIGQEVILSGNVILNYNNINGNLEEVKTVNINKDFTYYNRNDAYKVVLFNKENFAKTGEYQVDVNLEFTRGSWSSKYYKTIKIIIE